MLCFYSMPLKRRKALDLVKSINNRLIIRNLINPGQYLLLTISGGQDSICLLLIISQLKGQWEWNIAVLHCNHLWAKDSVKLTTFVFKIAFLCKIPILTGFTLRLVLTEQKARSWRLITFQQVNFFYNLNQVFTGHSSTDRVETSIFNLFRGSGLKGVASINWKNSKTFRIFSRSRDFFFKNEYRFCTNQNDPYERTTSQNNTYNRTTLAWHKWQGNPQKILNNVPLSNVFYCKSYSIAAPDICQTCFLNNEKLYYEQVSSTCCWLQTEFVRNKTSRSENRPRQRVWLFSTHLVNLWHKSIASSEGKRAALVGGVNELKHVFLRKKQVQSKKVNLNRHLYLQLQNNHLAIVRRNNPKALSNRINLQVDNHKRFSPNFFLSEKRKIYYHVVKIKMVSTSEPPVPCVKASRRDGLLHLLLKPPLGWWLWRTNHNHNHNHNATSCLSVINYLTKQPYKATLLPVFPGNKTALVVGSRHVKEQAFGCLARKQCFVTQSFLSESKMSMKTKTKEFFRPLKPLNLH